MTHDMTLPDEWLAFLLVLLGALGTHLLAGLILRQAHRLTALTDNHIDDALVAAARRPLPALIWLSGLALALHVAGWQTLVPYQEWIARVHMAGSVLCITWFAFALIREYSDRVLQAHAAGGDGPDHTTVHGLNKLARILVGIIGTLVFLQSLGFNISSLVALGGIGGLAIGMAARDWVANLIGGLMVHLGRPFDVGENIRSPDRQIEGRVEMISWLQTRLRTPNMTVVYVPNALFNTVVLENPSRMSNRRIDQTLVLRGQDIALVEAIVADMQRYLAQHAGIDAGKAIQVGLDDLTGGAPRLLVRAYSLTTDSAAFIVLKQGILLGLAEIIARHGAALDQETTVA